MMRAVCFIQEIKDADLTMRQQQLICRRALRKLLWPCAWEWIAQAGTEEQPISLRPGVAELMRAAATGEAEVLVITDVEHLHCSDAELQGFLMALLQNGVHTFSARSGRWVEPGGRHWMVMPGYDEADE